MLHARGHQPLLCDLRRHFVIETELEDVTAVVVRNIRERFPELGPRLDLELSVAEPGDELPWDLGGGQLVVLIDRARRGRDQQAVVDRPESQSAGIPWHSNQDAGYRRLRGCGAR